MRERHERYLFFFDFQITVPWLTAGYFVYIPRSDCFLTYPHAHQPKPSRRPQLENQV